MPPKKKAAKKKESLADPASLSDGRCNYYIGGWSFYQEFDDLTAISEFVTAAHTMEDGEVGPLPRTSVLVIPHSDPSDAMKPPSPAEGSEAGVVDVVVADKMYVEGVSRAALSRAVRNVTHKKPAALVVAPATTDAAPSDTTGMMQEAALSIEQTTSAHDTEPPSAPVPVTSDTASAEESAPIVGSAFEADPASRDVCVHCDIRIIGVLPTIVVRPQLPEPLQKAEDAVKKGKGGKKTRDTTKGGKSKMKKQTPEEIAQAEKQREEEAALWLKQTEEAIAAASAEEEHLMQFAHPSRWAHTTIANMTFTGPVQVTRAHVTFQNCVFASGVAGRPQLLVTQYCTVECVKCTFDSPVASGVYALPSSQVTTRRCLFSGVGHSAPAMTIHSAASNAAAREIAEVGGSEVSGAAGETVGEMVLNADSEVLALQARRERETAVGIQTDGAKVMIDSCRFCCLGTGVLLRGRYRQEPSVASVKGKPKTVSKMTVVNSQFCHLFNTAIFVDGTVQDVLAQGNRFSECGYYALDCRKGAHDVSVYKNTFYHKAIVRIREGTQPHFLHNHMQCTAVDDNVRDNPCIAANY